MAIVKLEASNFKRLTAVSIKPDGSLVTIAGKNGAGKSSTLDAIAAALGGGKSAPKEPIRKGQKKAQVIVETEDLIVKRVWNGKGSQLEVKGRNGSKVAKPQQLLDSLVGPISFDPLRLLAMSPREQAQLLRDLVGLDLSAEDEKREAAYEQRTEVNREVKRLRGALEKLPEADGAPCEPVSVAQLSDELERRRQVNAANEERRNALTNLRETAKRLQQEIADTKEKLDRLLEEFDATNEEGKKLSAEVKALEDLDLGEVKAQITNAEEINAAVRAGQERAKLSAELDEHEAEAERLTEYIEQIDQVKADAAASAKYPIDGLAVTDEGVTLDGVPFEQASQAQQLRASVAIGLAMNPQLKVLLVRDGSLLDDDNLCLVAELAEEAGGQVWLERVGNGDASSIVIEDGSVKEIE